MKFNLTRLLAASILFTVVITVFSACKQGTIDMQLKPVLNKEYHLKYDTKGTIVIELGSKKISQNIGARFGATLIFKQFLNNIYKIGFRYNDYEVTQFSSTDSTSLFWQTEKQLNSDSIKLSDSISHLQINKFISQLKVEADVDNKGSVSNLKETSGAFNMDSLNMDEMPEFVKTKIISGIKSIFENEMSKGILEQYLKVLPEKKVDIGFTWKNELVTNSILSMKIKNHFELINIKDSIAEVIIDAKIIPNQKEVVMPGLASMANHPSMKTNTKDKAADLMDINNIKINAEFAGDLKGKMFIDIRTGLIQHLTFNQKLNGNFEVLFFTLPMSMDMNTTYGLVP
ncbi:DUF6263 family protein [Polluticaenibacter yanchengensis]|uniref:DUF6263 family protein n=1 Tax=Polluticaenibacter yanchengensis TaxID=3014562 RepID=A0ABT4UG73_9BACT|nr:DUF6263 family protein [Chitinophagaceae bacterium LY-5]